MENYTTHIGNYLNYLQTANQVVSNNIANANTPNFKASEASFEESFGSSLRASGQNSIESWKLNENKHKTFSWNRYRRNKCKTDHQERLYQRRRQQCQRHF